MKIPQLSGDSQAHEWAPPFVNFRHPKEGRSAASLTAWRNARLCLNGPGVPLVWLCQSLPGKRFDNLKKAIKHGVDLVGDLQHHPVSRPYNQPQQDIRTQFPQAREVRRHPGVHV